MKDLNFPIMSIDVGRKRVGIAIIFSLSNKADYLAILSRESKKAEKEIIKLVNTKNIRLIVAGLPLDSKNRKTTQCLDVENFCQRIQKRCQISIKYVDEYLTSVEAQEKSNSRKAIDDIAAEIILFRYLSLYS